MKTCDECGRERTPDDFDYSPIQFMLGQPIGWYSGGDGELCGEDMSSLMYKANRMLSERHPETHVSGREDER